jgi:hypothetical protein
MRNRAKLRFGITNIESINASIENNASMPGRATLNIGRINLFAGPIPVRPVPAAVVVMASVNGVFPEFAGTDDGVNTHAESAGRP